jgi:DNA-binding XRE family transcriptional regulator
MGFMTATAGTPRARALPSAIREVRIASGTGLRELARKLSLSHSKISDWETGKRVPSVEQVAMILAHVCPDPDERESILSLARNVDEPNWLTVGIPGIPQQLAGAVECERNASTISEWSPMLVPGLLQTPDYARVIVSSNGLQTHEVETRLMVRLSRREVLNGNDPTQFNTLIGEAALRAPIVGKNLMIDQLRHLIDVAKRPNVAVWVVPMRAGWHPGIIGPFTIYEFPDSSPVIYFEHYSSGAFVPDPDDVKAYQSAVEIMREISIKPPESTEFIAQVADEWSREDE